MNFGSKYASSLSDYFTELLCSKYASSLSDYFTELLFSTTSQTLAARWHEAGTGKKLNHKHGQPYLTGLATGGLKPANPATDHRIPELLSTPEALKIQDYLPPSFPVTSRWNIEGHHWEGMECYGNTDTSFAHQWAKAVRRRHTPLPPVLGFHCIWKLKGAHLPVLSLILW